MGKQSRKPKKPAAPAEPLADQDEPQCFVCLGYEQPLLATGCGCRGSAGKVHVHCAIQCAAAAQERAGTALGPKAPWQKCATCGLPYTGELKLKLAEEWVRRAMESNDGGPIVLFAARTSLGNALAAGGRLAEAEVVARSNLETATAVYGAEHRFTLGTTHNLGLLLEQNGKAQEAEALFVSLLATQQRVLGPEARDTLMVATQVANSALGRGDYAAAEAQYRTLLKTQARVVGADDPSTLIVGMNLASALLGAGKYADAEAAFEANLEAKRRRLGPEHVDTLMAQMNLGIVLRERGDYEKAERILEENVEVKARVLGEGHLDTWTARLNLAATLLESRDRLTGDDASEARATAATLASDAREALTRELGASHPFTLGAAMHHGAALRAQGHRARASDVLRAALKEQVAVHGSESHPDCLETAWRLGDLLAEPRTEVSDADEAAALLRATAAHQEELLGGAHPRRWRTLVSLAVALLAMRGDGAAAARDEAVALLERAEAAQRAALGGGHPDVVKAATLLGVEKMLRP